MITLIVNGDVYTPEPAGRTEVLLLDSKIAKVGAVDRDALDRLGLDVDVVDAAGGYVVPGLVDPHEHLLGGSGEKGFAMQTPEITLSEIARAGITSVVGTLGVDTTMKTMAGLLAKAKGLEEEGLNAYVWTGGYSVPPSSIMNSVREDIMFIDEVIGAGELAISDVRAMDPEFRELARIVTDAHVAGMLSKKAGVTHFHVGSGKGGLSLLRRLIDEAEVAPEHLYPTHVERNEKLMDEAVELAGRGMFVDVDIHDRDLGKWLRYYLDAGGDPGRFTASSDAGTVGPSTLLDEVRSCVLEHGFRLEQVLPVVTSNTARVLKLEHKGTIEPGKIADIVVLGRESFEVAEVISRGRRLVKGGRMAVKEAFLTDSNRKIRLDGEDD